MIEYYQVHLNSSQSVDDFSLNTAGPETHVLINTFQPRTQYTCSVSAVTVSPGPASTPIHFTTNASGMTIIQPIKHPICVQCHVLALCKKDLINSQTGKCTKPFSLFV